jgi:hypothetical protein
LAHVSDDGLIHAGTFTPPVCNCSAISRYTVPLPQPTSASGRVVNLRQCLSDSWRGMCV